MAAMISAAAPAVWQSSVTTRTRPVLRTEASIVSVSSGASVRRSTTSTLMPSRAMRSAARRAMPTPRA